LTFDAILQRTQLENALGPQRQKFVSKVARKLHMEQPWYHGNISRETADQIMSQSDRRDGKFLYVLSSTASIFLDYVLHLRKLVYCHLSWKLWEKNYTSCFIL